MRKRRDHRQDKNNKKIISEPLPVTVNVDFQQMFSFPLSINNCTVKDLQNNNVKTLNETLEFFKFFPRRKSLPVRRKKGNDSSVLERHFDLKIPKRELNSRQFHSTPTTPTDGFICSTSDISKKPCTFTRQTSVPAIPSKPPRTCSEKIFVCNNCGEKEKLLGKVELDFKSCAYCFTHYCSARCQVVSLPSHLQVCYYGKIYKKLELLKNLICTEGNFNKEFEEFSIRGFKTKGRGCLFLTCASPFHLYKLIDREICIKPSYSNMDMLQKHTSKSKYQKAIIEKICSYEARKEFLCNITVIVGTDTPLEPLPRIRDKCIRILFCATSFQKRSDNDDWFIHHDSTKRRTKTL